MKSIFTYPNNPATFYINPLYIGNDTSGWQERMLNLKDGAYDVWPGGNPSATPLSDIITGTGKYNEAFEEASGNNTVYQFWLQPMLEAVMRMQNGIVVVSVSIEVVGTAAKLKFTTLHPHSFASATKLEGSGFTTTELNGATNAYYLQTNDSTSFYITADAAGTQFNLDFLDDTIYATQTVPLWQFAVGKPTPNGYTKFPKTIRRDFGGTQGSITDIMYNTMQQNVLPTTPLQMMSTFNFANNGSTNQIDTPFYVNYINGPTGVNTMVELFTDSAKTNRPSTQELYLGSLNKNYTTAGTHEFKNITQTSLQADWGFSTAELANWIQIEGDNADLPVNAGGNVLGFARVTATVNAGSFNGNVPAQQGSVYPAIPTTLVFDFEYQAYWDSSTGYMDILTYPQGQFAGLTEPAGFVITDTGSGVNVDIEVKLIRAGVPDSGMCPYLNADTTDAGAILKQESAVIVHEISTLQTILPGGETFQYQDVNNVTQPGAVWEGDYWFAGDVTATPLPAGETMPTDNDISVDVNGRLSAIDVTGAGGRGIFLTDTTRLFKIKAKPNTYVPPVVTPAEEQDVWNTEDQWATNTYLPNPQKLWPRHVSPMSAEVNYSSPTIVNMSQSGIKYTRSAGHTKWTLDVVYPPMKVDDFKIFHAIAQAAHGQSTPFHFDLRSKNNTRILWGATYVAGQNTTTQARLITDMNPGDVIWYVEGFASDEANAFMQGEVFIDGENENGNLHTALSGTAANVFGEAKFRAPWPVRNLGTTGQIIYKDPAHAVVTLNSDDFSWETDNQDFYYVSVSFDLDQWQGT